MAEREVRLTGGNMSVVVRVGGTVRRSGGPWSGSVQLLLAHLRQVGFDGAPEPMGFDDQGREVVSYIEGEAGGPEMPDDWWSDDNLVTVARLVRRFHDAAASFTPPHDAAWVRLPGLPGEGPVVCHHDLAPYNTIYRDGEPVAFIDWDAASPAPPIWTLPMQSGDSWTSSTASRTPRSPPSPAGFACSATPMAWPTAQACSTSSRPAREPFTKRSACWPRKATLPSKRCGAPTTANGRDLTPTSCAYTEPPSPTRWRPDSASRPLLSPVGVTWVSVPAPQPVGEAPKPTTASAIPSPAKSVAGLRSDDTYAVVNLNDVGSVTEFGGLAFKPLRRLLGIQAFGVAVWTAAAGESLVADHAEDGEFGQEELYVVLSGCAEFVVGSETVTLDAGGCLAVRPGVQRSARAAEADAVVLAVGAPRGKAFEAWGWEFSADALPYYRNGQYEQAAAIYAEALEQYPGSPNLLYNLACCEARLGGLDAALDHLRRAVVILPRMGKHAQSDDDLRSIREDPRFPSGQA